MKNILFNHVRGHNITFLSGFPADYSYNGIYEVTPSGLSEYIQNYTNWDLVGVRMEGKLPYSVWDVIRFAFEVCKNSARFYANTVRCTILHRFFFLLYFAIITP